MAINTRHFTLTVGTTATTLYALATAAVAGKIGTAKQLMIQPHSENLAVIYGGSPTDGVTTTNYGWLLPIPVSGVPSAPFPIESGSSGLISLAAIQVLAANATDKIHVFLVTP